MILGPVQRALIEASVEECKRFMSRCEDALKRDDMHKEREALNARAFRTREMGAVRRASLDLSQSLVDLRHGRL